MTNAIHPATFAGKPTICHAAKLIPYERLIR
jgi:hypothetical protein